MTTPLLRTKLYIPPLRPDPSTAPLVLWPRDKGLRTGLVSRPRLIERLNVGLTGSNESFMI